MSKKKIVQLEIKTESFKGAMKDAKNSIKDAVKETDNLSKGQNRLQRAAAQANNAIVGGIKKASAAAAKLIKANPRLAKGFRAAGKAARAIGRNAKKGAKIAGKAFRIAGKAASAAFAATGILALIGGIAGLLQRSQKVRDLFEKISRTIGILVDTGVDAVMGFVDTMGGITGILDKIKSGFKAAFSLDGLKKFGQAIIDNIMERFNSVIDTLGFIGKALGKLVKGDFKGMREEFANAGKEMVDVMTGIDGSVDKAVATVKDLGGALVDTVTSAYSAADAIVEMEKKAAILEKSYENIKAAAEGQLEQQRAIADDATRSTQERLDANNKLQEITDKLHKDEVANLNEQLAAQNAILALQPDNQEALEKQAELQAKITTAGKERDALNREHALRERAINLEAVANYQAQEDRERELQDLKDANRVADIEDEEERLKVMKEMLKARVDDEKSDLDNALQQMKDAGLEESKEYADLLHRKAMLDEQYKADVKELDDAEAERKKQAAEDEVELEKTKQDRKKELVSAGLNAASALLELFGKGNEKRARTAFKINKALALSTAVADTAGGVIAAIKDTKGPTGFERWANAAAVGAAGAVNIAKIASSKFETGNAATETTVAPTLSTAPQGGNLTSGDRNSQLLADVNNSPVKAYVVSGDVSSQQELDRKRANRAKL